MPAAPGSRTLAQAGVVAHNMTVEILEELEQCRWMRGAQMSSPRNAARLTVVSGSNHHATVEADHMDNDQLDGQIDEREHIRRRHDLALAKPISQPERRRARNDVAVFSLVAGSAVLLAVALATTSVAAGCGGVALFSSRSSSTTVTNAIAAPGA